MSSTLLPTKPTLMVIFNMLKALTNTLPLAGPLQRQAVKVLRQVLATTSKDESRRQRQTTARVRGPGGAVSTVLAGHAGTRTQPDPVRDAQAPVCPLSASHVETAYRNTDPSRLERQFKEHMEDNSASSNKILSKLTTIEDNTNELIKHTKGIRKSARGARILLRNLNYNTKLTRASINVGGSQIREAVLENTQVQRASQTRLEQMFQRSEDNNRAQQQRTEEMWSAFLQRAYD